MSFLTRLFNVQSRKIHETMNEYDSKRIAKLSTGALKTRIAKKETKYGERFSVACELAKRDEIEFLSSLIGNEKEMALAAVDGLSDAACNGNKKAMKELSAFIIHPDSDVRSRVVLDLEIIADGTPGDYNYSTDEIRTSAHALLEQAGSDKDYHVARSAKEASARYKDVKAVRRGDDNLTFKGRHVATAVLRVAEKYKRNR